MCVLVKTKEKTYPNDMGSLPVTSHFRSSFGCDGGKLAFIVSVRSSKTQADPREKFWSTLERTFRNKVTCARVDTFESFSAHFSGGNKGPARSVCRLRVSFFFFHFQVLPVNKICIIVHYTSILSSKIYNKTN
jgi:hypothetical protein